MKRLTSFAFCLILILSACAAPRSGRSVWQQRVASFSQNFVSVDILLRQDSSQRAYLTATFTPENGDHLYSKDLPRTGVFGEGRPTLLELTPHSQMHSDGILTASPEDEVTNMGMDGLLVYPAGPVTLRLQVSLPEGSGWYDDQVSVTYEACSQTTCLTPVIGKLVAVQVPGSEGVQP